MVERSTRLAASAGAIRLCAASLCAVLALAFTAAEAGASSGAVRADSDGYVPVSYSCFGGGAAGLYSWFFDGRETYGSITINECLLDRIGAGPQGYERMLEHEMGHSRGFGHSSSPASPMYPTMSITGG